MVLIWSCIVVVFAVGLWSADNYATAAEITRPKDCFTTAPILTLISRKLINGTKNTGNCSCEQAKEIRRIYNVIGADWYVPQCDATGHFMTKQIHNPWGSAWCVDSNGNQIGETVLGDLVADFTDENIHFLQGAAGRLKCLITV